jgi:hypothetical protein
MMNNFMYVNSKKDVFDNVVKKVSDIQASCKDYMLDGEKPVSVFAMNANQPEDVKLKFTAKTKQNEIVPSWFLMRDTSFNQLCTHFSIPSAYMKRCMDTDRSELMLQNMNSWLEQNTKDFLVRVNAGTVRGMLTTKYSAFDAPDMLDVVQDTLNTDSFDVVGQYVTDERLHIRLAEKQRMNIDGEDLFGGIQIDSSDVGLCSMRISYFVYKQVCTNGLCVSKGGGILFAQKHIGISKDAFREEFAAKLSTLDEYQEDIKSQIIRAKKEHLDDMTLEKILAKLKAEQKIGEAQNEKIIQLMNTRYDRSRFGLVNGITEVAQSYSLEKRIQLESFASKVLLAA